MMNHSFGLAVALHARGPSLRLKGIQAVCYTSSLFCYCLTAPQILLHQGFHCHSRPLHLPSHCQGPPHLSRSYFLTCPRPVLCRCPPPRPVLCRCPLPHPVLCRYPLRPVVQHRICRCCSSSSSQDTGCQCDQPHHLGIT